MARTSGALGCAMAVGLLLFVSAAGHAAPSRDTAGVYVEPAYVVVPSGESTTVSVMYDGTEVAGGLRGYHVEVVYDTSLIVVDSLGGDVVQGNFLSGVGPTTFFPQWTGDNSFSVDCSILGVTSGATGIGELLTIEFASQAEGHGVSPVQLINVSLRDQDNLPISSITTDGEIDVQSVGPDAPTMTAEPSYTQGLANTVLWSNESASGAVEYYAEASDEAARTTIASGWIGGLEFEFTGLDDGAIYDYRVKARASSGAEGDWSNAVSSTQDDTPPTSSAGNPGATQNQLTFDVPFSADDATSGVDNVTLYYRLDGGGYAQYGTTFTTSPISFTAPGGGTYDFYTTATDEVGNVEAAPGSPDASTLVDVTAPDAPVLAAEPAYTAGLANTVSWSDESASGATEYFAEATDGLGRATIVSGWIAGTQYVFANLDDGVEYEYRVMARDDALNESAWSNTVASTQDDTPPATAAGDPGAAVGTLTFDVPFTATDSASGVALVRLFYQVDGGGYAQYGGTYTVSPISFTAPGEGTYDFYTTGTDSVGNVESAPGSPDATTIVDQTAPDQPVIDGEPEYTRGLTNTVSWSDESGSGATEYYAEATDGAARVTIASGWIAGTQHEFTDLVDGTSYDHRVMSRDAAENESGWSPIVTSTQDATAPATAAQSPGATQTTLTFDVPYTAFDGTSGLDYVELFYRVDGGGYAQYGTTYATSPISFAAPGEGTYDFYTIGTDNAGNVESAPGTPDASTVVDADPPDVPVMAGEPTYTQGLTNTVSWSDESASGATEYQAQTATNAGFTENVVSSGWTAATDFPFGGLSDGGTYWYRAMARDAVENESAWSGGVSSTQDDTSPTTSAQDPGATHTTYTFDVPFSGSDATSGLESVQLFYQVDGGGYLQYGATFATSPISFTASGDGAYDFYTVGTDGVGNVEPAPGTPDASTLVDVIGPDIPAMTSEPAYTAGLTNTVSWTDESASGATEYYAEATDGAGRVTIGSGWIAETEHEFAGLTDGVAYEYRVRARDVTLNESDWSFPEVSSQDDTPPATSVLDPGPVQGAATFDLAFWAADATSGLDDVTLFYRVDGGGYSQYGGSFTASPISFTVVGPGTYDFYTTGTDLVGNVEDAPGVPDATTVVDLSAPIPPTMADEPRHTRGFSNTVSWSDESASGAAEYYAEATTGDASNREVIGSGWIAETAHEFTGLTDGETYDYRVRARNLALNESGWSAAATSTQDASPPATAVAGIVQFVGGLTFDVPFTATDAVSGVERVELWYRLDDAGYQQYPGAFVASPIDFTCEEQGHYAFYTTGVDSLGNEEPPPEGADGVTVVDAAAPPGVVRAVAAPRHNAVELSWKVPLEGDTPTAGGPVKGSPIEGTLIVRREWGPGAYPEYDDVIPSDDYPAGPTDGTVVGFVPGIGDRAHVDDSFDDASRNVYLYTLFTRDAAGNYSEVGAHARSTSYRLGDVDESTGSPGAYDGVIDFYDKLVFSLCYGTEHGDPLYNAEMDIGPTDDKTGTGVPLTDDTIGFDDLIVLSLNYGPGRRGPIRALAVLPDEETGAPMSIALEKAGGTLETGSVLLVDLVLAGNGDSLKAASCLVGFDPAELEFLAVEGPAVTESVEDEFFFHASRVGGSEVRVDLAVLGGGTTIGGAGRLARLSFRVVADARSDIALRESILRDLDNADLSHDALDLELGGDGRPSTLSLSQNVPNPFAPSTTIAFELPERAFVSIVVYDVGGRLVRALTRGSRGPGRHAVDWDGRDSRGAAVASGIYFYVLDAGEKRLTNKMVIAR